MVVVTPVVQRPLLLFFDDLWRATIAAQNKK